MSRTDKHRPVWVQLADPENKGFAQEEHNHEKGFCDLGEPARYSVGWRHWSWCHISESRLAWASGMWPKMPRKGGWSRPNQRDGKARMRLRALEAEVLKVHRALVYYTAPWSCDPDWADQLPDWDEHKPTNAWLWWKSD